MKIRIGILRILYSIPHFKGRDRIIGILLDSFSQTPTALQSDELTMYLDASEYAQLEILLRGSSEPRTLALIRELVNEGDAVVDIGAHVGHHALVAARRAGCSGRVIAVDPQPYNADRISRHAAINGLTNVTTICAAVGNDETYIKLPVQSERDRCRLSLHEPGPNNLAVAVEVPLRRLDEVFERHEIAKVKLLKIDVEGYELEVLQGLGNRIFDCSNIILELLNFTDDDRNQTVVDLLVSAGFVLKDCIGKDWTWGEPLLENNLWAGRPEGF